MSSPFRSRRRGSGCISNLCLAASVYNRPANIRMRGPLDVGFLRQALNHTFTRQQSIWITAQSSGATARLIRESPVELELPFTDLSNESDQQALAGQIAAAEAGRPFDLNQAPLVRSRLLRISDEDHLLLLTFHEFAFDAWSQAVLLRELTAAYQAFAEAEVSSLGRPQIQYSDFAVWDRSQQRLDGFAEGRDYWRRELADLPTLQLPTDRCSTTRTIRTGGASSIFSCRRTLLAGCVR